MECIDYLAMRGAELPINTEPGPTLLLCKLESLQRLGDTRAALRQYDHEFRSLHCAYLSSGGESISETTLDRCYIRGLRLSRADECIVRSVVGDKFPRDAVRKALSAMLSRSVCWTGDGAAGKQ